VGLPPLPAARALAHRLGCVVVRKGHGTVVAAPDGRAFLNTTGGDGLAKGGSGDLLCGLAAGFLAQGLPPLEGAACAAHLHGLAGDLAQARLGARAMLPRDLLDDLPTAYRRCGWDRPG
jgi:NAD(P)H-hydrate epimerase